MSRCVWLHEGRGATHVELALCAGIVLVDSLAGVGGREGFSAGGLWDANTRALFTEELVFMEGLAGYLILCGGRHLGRGVCFCELVACGLLD